MRFLFYSLLIFFALNMFAFSQDENSQHNEKAIITGLYLWNDWEKETNWELPKDYEINKDSLNILKNLISKNNIKFLIFAGSWCGDSKSELPKIILIFQKIGLQNSNYQLYGVDREKLEPTLHSAEFNIEKVPTLVVLENDKEIGRIVEYPKQNWIDDLIQIIVNH